MKNFHVKYIVFSIAAFIILGVNACNKTVQTGELEANIPLTRDANGGAWQPFLLTSASEFAVEAPKDFTSPEYLTELRAVRNIQAAATDQQKTALKYWAAGGTIRWNEIARELAAQYNTPPNYNADGTYPVPDAANPSVYPRFPFANPPYASRAFALLSVAQYDALVATYYYKNLYKRLAPYKYEAAITPSVPVSDCRS